MRIAKSGVVCEQARYNRKPGNACGSSERVSYTIVIHQAGFELNVWREIAQCSDGVSDIVDDLRHQLSDFICAWPVAYLIFIGNASKCVWQPRAECVLHD
jgi:hypothetical protein